MKEILLLQEQIDELTKIANLLLMERHHFPQGRAKVHDQIAAIKEKGMEVKMSLDELVMQWPQNQG